MVFFIEIKGVEEKERGTEKKRKRKKGKDHLTSSEEQ